MGVQGTSLNIGESIMNYFESQHFIATQKQVCWILGSDQDMHGLLFHVFFNMLGPRDRAMESNGSKRWAGAGVGVGMLWGGGFP